MTVFDALAFYPPWAVSLATGLVAWRFARRTGVGLVLISVLLAGWISGLLLLDSGAAAWAERLLPAGMLLAGAFTQAAAEVARRSSRRVVTLAWTASGAITLLGLVAPRMIYGPGARGAGPLFPLLAVLSIVGTLSVKWWLWTLVRAAPPGRERRRRLALFAANTFAALGGGGTITLHILGWAPIAIAAPFLLLCVPMAAAAVWSTEDARGRELLGQGFAHALATAVFSAIALPTFLLVLPRLIPGGEVWSAWGAAVCFLATLPIDPLRQLVVDRLAGVLFSRPLTVPSLAREVERQADRAEHAERLAEIGHIASAVAHEVRNPLGVILAEAKLLETTGADPESVATLRQQVQRASRFVDELLRYAKPRPLDLSEVDVAQIAGEAVRNATRALSIADGAVVLEATRCQVEADRAALLDVLVNLVSNALIAVEGRAQPGVRVRIEAEDGAARIVVEDDGPGVPKEIEGRLFEPFVTGRGRDAKHPGTGLGLALCQRLAQRHGARIAHERPSTGGARFVVRWPRTPALSE